MSGMPSFETAIRLLVIGQELLIAVIFLAGRNDRVVRVSGALLMLGVVGYLWMSNANLRESVPSLQPLAVLLSMIVPYCLWVFSRAIFEFPWPNRWMLGTPVLVGLVVWLIFINGETLGQEMFDRANIVKYVVSLSILLHALWFTLAGRLDDLLEGRRVFRLFFVVIVGVQAFVVLLVEFVLGGRPAGGLDLVNTLIIAVMTIGLAVPLLRLNPEFFAPEPSTKPSVEPFAESLTPGDSVLQQKLLQHMDSCYYRESGLTIRTLATKLAHPEHQLRRLINGQLGYRNFSAFLNAYRIAAAKQALADPERARIPVLTIALELGYGSLGPFNRAFKVATTLTPSDYRRKYCGSSAPDTDQN